MGEMVGDAKAHLQAKIEVMQAKIEQLNQQKAELWLSMEEPQKVAARHIAEENELRAEIKRLRE